MISTIGDYWYREHIFQSVPWAELPYHSKISLFYRTLYVYKSYVVSLLWQQCAFDNSQVPLNLSYNNIRHMKSFVRKRGNLSISENPFCTQDYIPSDWISSLLFPWNCSWKKHLKDRSGCNFQICWCGCASNFSIMLVKALA